MDRYSKLSTDTIRGTLPIPTRPSSLPLRICLESLSNDKSVRASRDGTIQHKRGQKNVVLRPPLSFRSVKWKTMGVKISVIEILEWC